MKLRLEGRLTFVPVWLSHRGREVFLEKVLVDTGAESSVFSSDELALAGILPEPVDVIDRMTGVGGLEIVLTKRIERLATGGVEVSEFLIQMGAMEYGFPIQRVLGMDFLLKTASVIDLGELDISWKEQEPSPPS